MRGAHTTTFLEWKVQRKVQYPPAQLIERISVVLPLTTLLLTFFVILSIVPYLSSLSAAATYFIKLTLPNLMALIHSRDITVGSIKLVTSMPRDTIPHQ